MPTFKVYLTETVQYEVIVEADDEDAAKEIAVETWAECENPNVEFNGQGQGVEADFAEICDIAVDMEAFTKEVLGE